MKRLYTGWTIGICINLHFLILITNYIYKTPPITQTGQLLHINYMICMAYIVFTWAHAFFTLPLSWQWFRGIHSCSAHTNIKRWSMVEIGPKPIKTHQVYNSVHSHMTSIFPPLSRLKRVTFQWRHFDCRCQIQQLAWNCYRAKNNTKKVKRPKEGMCRSA